MREKSFGIIGGDMRQAALAESISGDGNIAYACFLEKAPLSDRVKKAGLEETALRCGYIVLPLPAVAGGKYLKADLSYGKILLDDGFAEKLQGKKIFCGMAEKLKATSRLWENNEIYDYSESEEFKIGNALLTAEGALGTAMREFGGTVHGSRCLVAGFGRIGKTLAYMLRGIGADVAVSARKRTDLSWIKTYGYRPVPAGSMCAAGRYDIIFNTVPEVIFDKGTLGALDKNTLIIDLASPPGGVDMEAARECKIKTVAALSLPGKTAPEAAGEIIKNIIYNIINETSVRGK